MPLVSRRYLTWENPRPWRVADNSSGRANLLIKAFIDNSKNAVLSQIFVALIVYLLLCYLKFLCNPGITLQTLMRLLQLNLFIPSCDQTSRIVILSAAKNLDSSLRFAPFRMTNSKLPL